MIHDLNEDQSDLLCARTDLQQCWVLGVCVGGWGRGGLAVMHVGVTRDGSVLCFV